MAYDPNYELTNAQQRNAGTRQAVEDFMGFFKAKKLREDEEEKRKIQEQIRALTGEAGAAQGEAEGLKGAGVALEQAQQVASQADPKTGFSLLNPALDIGKMVARAGQESAASADVLAKRRKAAAAKAHYATKYGVQGNVASPEDFLTAEDLAAEKLAQARLGTQGLGLENKKTGLETDLMSQLNPLKVGAAQDEAITGPLKARADIKKTESEIGALDRGQWAATPTLEGGIIGFNTRTGKTLETGYTPIPKPGAGGKASKLTTEQQGKLERFGEAQVMLDDLVTQFKESKITGASGAAADVVESVPFIGGKLAPKTAEYNRAKKAVAESFLRAATGAAAPASEVKTYMGFLPTPGDNETQAQAKLDGFRIAVKAKALGVARGLRLQGRNDLADEIEGNINEMLAKGLNILTEVAASEGNNAKAKKYGLD